MSTPNKYHSSGREYTATELAERRRAATPVYLVLSSYVPYHKGRNDRKRVLRASGFKSLKQWDRHLERTNQF